MNLDYVKGLYRRFNTHPFFLSLISLYYYYIAFSAEIFIHAFTLKIPNELMKREKRSSLILKGPWSSVIFIPLD